MRKIKELERMSKVKFEYKHVKIKENSEKENNK